MKSIKKVVKVLACAAIVALSFNACQTNTDDVAQDEELQLEESEHGRYVEGSVIVIGQ